MSSSLHLDGSLDAPQPLIPLGASRLRGSAEDVRVRHRAGTKTLSRF
jgi:hypothetical protein